MEKAMASKSHSTAWLAGLWQQCPKSVSGSEAPSGVSKAVGVSWSGQCFAVNPESPEPGIAGGGG